METTKPYPIGIIKRTGFIDYDRKRFPDADVTSINIYSTSFCQTIETPRKIKTKRRIYLVELHNYHGFGMVKFYPKSQKNNSRKYKIRGEEIGFCLNFGEIRQVLKFCALVMKTYLDDYPDHFIGYIGQTDQRDNLLGKMRAEAQRAHIYDRYTSSLFTLPKYSLSAKELFGPINMKLIRRAVKHKEFTLTDNQKFNYNNFKSFIEKKQNLIPELMTDVTRKKFYPHLFNN
jgi:hypothetical protein